MEVWQPYWQAFSVFEAMSTQWRTGMGGASGLDYAAIPAVMSLGSLQRGWNTLASAAKGAWDAMLGIGQEQTLKKRIDDLQSYINDRARLGGYDNTDYERQLKALKAQLATEQQRSKEQGEQRKQNTDAIEAVTKVKALTDASRGYTGRLHRI